MYTRSAFKYHFVIALESLLVILLAVAVVIYIQVLWQQAMTKPVPQAPVVAAPPEKKSTDYDAIVAALQATSSIKLSSEKRRRIIEDLRPTSYEAGAPDQSAVTQDNIIQ